MRRYFVYIMTNRSRTLYAGVTSNLERRILEHKRKIHRGFTSKYQVCKLVWFEDFYSIDEALLAEKRIKGWLREKKVALIEATNPHWLDLAENLDCGATENGSSVILWSAEESRLYLDELALPPSTSPAQGNPDKTLRQTSG